MTGRRLKLDEDHPATLETENDLAILHVKQGDYDKAKLLPTEAFNRRRLKLGDTRPHTLESLNNLIELYEAWNKPEKTEEWQAKLTQREDFEE
ncbi:MAG: tetratricopeptide repeat protein [Phycisphaerales bacterium]|nr:MAG: tetratricopeptide repeat protein [Phycisphaerales bacterium]